MINKILLGIIKMIISLTALLTMPIDNLIASAIPDLSNLTTSIAGLFSIINSGIQWAISLSGISTLGISLLIMFYSIKLQLPIVIYTIKLALAWYDKIKP